MKLINNFIFVKRYRTKSHEKNVRNENFLNKIKNQSITLTFAR